MTNDAPYQGLKYEHGQFSPVDDNLTGEEALQININGEPYTVIMRSPGHEKEMTRGLLWNEDLYKGSQSFPMDVLKTNGLGHITEVNVTIPEEQLGKGYLNTRSMLSVSSCGICGKRELGDLKVEGEALDASETIKMEVLNGMFTEMRKHQQTFSLTGGSHASAAFTLNGELLAIMEDVGRHNAVDKVVGALLDANKLHKAKVLLVSGRVSYEIVTKAFMARLPVLAAVSAPSTLAVDYAKELGITLFGFCREDKATCYANIQRLDDNGNNKKEAS